MSSSEQDRARGGRMKRALPNATINQAGDPMKLSSMHHIPLASAYLCPNCSCVGNCSERCPACASTALLGLANILDREHEEATQPESSFCFPGCDSIYLVPPNRCLTPSYLPPGRALATNERVRDRCWRGRARIAC